MPTAHRQTPTPLLLATLLLSTGLARLASAQAPRKPNVIFILADDLGYGDVGCYGQQRIRTPNLDRMAREGVRFTSFYAGSTVCAPSRCVLMTGLHTGHCRIRGNARVNLPPEDRTVAEQFKEQGYTTALVGKWGLGQEGSTGVPTRQGFDHFFGYLDQHHAHNYYPSFLVRNEERVQLKNVVPGDGPYGVGVASQKVEYSHDLMAEDALRWLERNREKPFFLYLAYTLPHANNEGKQDGMEVPDVGEYAGTDWPENQKRHAAMISRLDRDIGRLLQRLKEYGIDERTVVFFSSDNGPHREGGNNPDFNDSNGHLRGIKRDLTEGGIRVPMIVRWPGKAPAGKTSDHAGYFADFMVTAAEIAGAPAPKGTDGVSFLPSILGQPERQKRHEALYWEFHERGSTRAVRMGDWKGIQKPWNGPVQLYNLKEDLGETRDVADQHPDVVARVKAALEKEHVDSEQFPVNAR